MSEPEKGEQGQPGKETPQPQEQDRLMSCSIDNIRKISKETEKGALLVFTQEGCPYCPPFMEEVQKTVGDSLTVVEAGLEDAECLGLAKDLGAKGTPTAYYFKQGEKVAEIDPSGRSWEEIRQELKKLVQEEPGN